MLNRTDTIRSTQRRDHPCLPRPNAGTILLAGLSGQGVAQSFSAVSYPGYSRGMVRDGSEIRLRLEWERAKMEKTRTSDHKRQDAGDFNIKEVNEVSGRHDTIRPRTAVHHTTRTLQSCADHALPCTPVPIDPLPSRSQLAQLASITSSRAPGSTGNIPLSASMSSDLSIIPF